MIGVVVVSHSVRLAEAAVELAVQMVQGDHPPIEFAAGAADDVLGTDAVRVADAIARAAGDDGCVVLMDLGSSLMSAELAIELTEVDASLVRLSRGPFIEGLLAAIVSSAGGAGLDAVLAEADGALAAKRAQLGRAAEEDPLPSAEAGAPERGGSDRGAAEAGGSEREVVADIELTNEVGLHARPAAAVVRAAAEYDADVSVANLSSGAGPVPARSLMGLLSLAAAKGAVLRVRATGPQAREAVDRIRAEAETGFGER